ncbi:MAG TPA: hypothetical protein VK859_16660, partial [bacterium]|nr:hypothetical protein [bacterium]
MRDFENLRTLILKNFLDAHGFYPGFIIPQANPLFEFAWKLSLPLLDLVHVGGHQFPGLFHVFGWEHHR